MIRLNDVSFQYASGLGGVSEINLTVHEGECLVLTGPSGGGKTTLTRLLNGLAPSYNAGKLTGTIFLNGKSLAQTPQFALARQVGSIFQDPKSQFFSSDLAGEVAFACENYGLPGEEIQKRTNHAISAFSLDDLRFQNLDVLSSGEKQKVAIASVYALRPNIYVCDEPTSNLDREGSRQIALILKKLKAEGCTLVIAEHRLSWLRGIADRFVYIRDGKILWERSAAEMEHLSAGQRKADGLREIIESRNMNVSFSMNHGDKRPILCVTKLSCKRKKTDVFCDISFSAYAGQVTAITGHNGVGKTSLALVLSGLWKEKSGQILINGVKMRPGERRKQIWYGSNDTGTQFFTNSVTEELLLHLERSEERLERTRSLLKRLDLYRYKDAHPASLSGGQKQRLSIACGILSERKILIFDEPTSGLDGGNMGIVADVLQEEAHMGKAILVITHDEELIRCCCDCLIKIDEYGNRA